MRNDFVNGVGFYLESLHDEPRNKWILSFGSEEGIVEKCLGYFPAFHSSEVVQIMPKDRAGSLACVFGIRVAGRLHMHLPLDDTSLAKLIDFIAGGYF